jgi:hypothetical protein
MDCKFIYFLVSKNKNKNVKHKNEVVELYLREKKEEGRKEKNRKIKNQKLKIKN